MVLVECYHCGNRFRFDETQIIKATLSHCPDCGTQLLITVVTENGETRYEASPPVDRASARGAQAFGLTLSDMQAQGLAPAPRPAATANAVRNPYEAVQRMKAEAAKQAQAQAPTVGVTLADMPAFNPAAPQAPAAAVPKPTVKNPYEAVQKMKAEAAKQAQVQAPTVGVTLADMPAFSPGAPQTPAAAVPKPTVKNPYEAVQKMKAEAAKQAQAQAPAVGVTLADMPAFNPGAPQAAAAPTPKPAKPKAPPAKRPGHVFRPSDGAPSPANTTPSSVAPGILSRPAPGVLSANRPQTPSQAPGGKKSLSWFWILVWGAAIVAALVSLGVINFGD